MPTLASQLPVDVLSKVLATAMPAGDADGFMPAAQVARLCAAFSCCRAWREALHTDLLASATVAEQGLRLLCCGSRGEMAWLRTPWLKPLPALKFSYSEGRWEGTEVVCIQRVGGLIRSLDPVYRAYEDQYWKREGWERGASDSEVEEDVYSSANASCDDDDEDVEEEREEGLEARPRDVLHYLPSPLPELFIDFEDCSVDVDLVPTRVRRSAPLPAPSKRAGGRRFALLRLRSPVDCHISTHQLAELADVAGTLEVEAPVVVVGVKEGELSWAGGVFAAVPLARDKLQIALHALLQTGAAAVGCDPAAQRGNTDVGGGGERDGGGRGFSLRLDFKGLVFIQKKPFFRQVAITQLLALADTQHAEYAAPAGSVELAPLPGRQVWYQLTAGVS